MLPQQPPPPGVQLMHDSEDELVGNYRLDDADDQVPILMTGFIFVRTVFV